MKITEMKKYMGLALVAGFLSMSYNADAKPRKVKTTRSRVDSTTTKVNGNKISGASDATGSARKSVPALKEAAKPAAVPVAKGQGKTHDGAKTNATVGEATEASKTSDFLDVNDAWNKDVSLRMLLLGYKDPGAVRKGVLTKLFNEYDSEKDIGVNPDYKDKIKELLLDPAMRERYAKLKNAEEKKQFLIMLSNRIDLADGVTTGKDGQGIKDHMIMYDSPDVVKAYNEAISVFDDPNEVMKIAKELAASGNHAAVKSILARVRVDPKTNKFIFGTKADILTLRRAVISHTVDTSPEFAHLNPEQKEQLKSCLLS